MKSDDRGIRFRAFGQRSIVSSSESSPSSALAKGSGGSSRISLSDFLNRKLPKTSAPAGTVQTKSRPFSTLVEPRRCVLPQHEHGGDKDGVNEEKERSIDKVIFQQFKLSDKEREDCAVSCRLDEGGSFQVEEEVQESRKRKNPFQVELQGGHNSGKHVVVLGKGPKPKPRGRTESFIRNTNPRTEYNHYENGSGFWDSSMLGIDNDEVGFSEIWEGVGSTTLGGIEWH